LPETDIVTETTRIINEAQKRGVLLRLLGGLAIRLHSPSAIEDNLRRKYADIDVVGLRSQGKEIKQLFCDLGYSPRTTFNALHGAYRLIFNDIQNERRVDVFLNVFEMSHKLDFSNRLKITSPTLPLADLLLTKLQVYEITEREYKDVIALLKDHEFTMEEEPEGINASYIASLCSEDWGLYRTVKLNIERISSSLGSYGLSSGVVQNVKGKLELLATQIETRPKSFRWKLRAKVGDRVRWYELPEADKEVVDSRPMIERKS
jgi:hypothetical protein